MKPLLPVSSEFRSMPGQYRSTGQPLGKEWVGSGQPTKSKCFLLAGGLGKATLFWMGSKQRIMSAFLQGAPPGPTWRTGHVERALLKGAMSQHVAGERDRGEKANGICSFASLCPEPAGHKPFSPEKKSDGSVYQQVLSHAIVAGVVVWGFIVPGGAESCREQSEILSTIRFTEAFRPGERSAHCRIRPSMHHLGWRRVQFPALWWMSQHSVGWAQSEHCCNIVFVGLIF